MIVYFICFLDLRFDLMFSLSAVESLFKSCDKCAQSFYCFACCSSPDVRVL